MKTLKIFTILAILLAALFVVGGSASARSLAASGTTFINGVFASGNTLASTHYQMQAVVGEAGLPDGATDLSSANYRHQPGFLAASISTSTPTPTPTAIFTSTPTPTTTSTPTRTPTQTATQTFTSVAVQDGWVLESAENSSVGGSMNSSATTIYLGDDATKKQYRGILSFSTGGLPDTAVITKVTLKVMKQAIVGGGNPVTTFQGFMVDIKNGTFGTSVLQITDFQTAANATYGPFLTAPVGNWYSIDLTAGKAFVNKLATGSGLTQIRLRFKLDDNNNTLANYLSLYSGNMTTAADRPQLVITYTVP
ncbi:MAG: DNRLRE domain-containing protein [Anaerolineales bacterium]